MLQRLAVPIAIVVAGGLIAGALYFVNAKATPQGGNNEQETLGTIEGVRAGDHVRGNPNAKIVFIEYSDTECPYCKQFHAGLKQIMDQYGANGDVAWVYRHFPIPQLHSKAPQEAQAMECAAKLGGNDAFWKYTDRIYEVTPSNNGLDLTELPKIAAHVGLDQAAFEACLNSDYGKDVVSANAAEGAKAGITGTPTSVVIANGTQVPLEGYYPYESLKQLVDSVLAQ